MLLCTRMMIESSAFFCFVKADFKALTGGSSCIALGKDQHSGKSANTATHLLGAFGGPCYNVTYCCNG